MNDLMIPEKADVPAYALNPELARQANEDMAAGISTGFPPRLKVSASRFVLVDGNGEETAYPQAKMVAGPDENLYLPLIVLRARKALQKTWYAQAYNPDAEHQAPDCFSNDGEKPDPGSLAKQSEVCANCPYNAFGSGKDQSGNPTKGKACSDSKILAVFVPSRGIHSFKLPPASLKNFGIYVKQLSSQGIPVGNVRTFVGFDPTASFPLLIFRFGGFVPEGSLAKLRELTVSPEAEEVIEARITPALPAPPPAAKAPAQDLSMAGDVDAADLGLDGDVGGDTAAAKRSEAAKKTAKASPKAPAAAKTPPKAPAPKAPAAAGPTDEEIMQELGLI